jgi:hypothetical protein
MKKCITITKLCGCALLPSHNTFFLIVIRQGGYDDEGLDGSGLKCDDDVSFTMESGAQGDQSAHFGLQTEDGGSIMVGGSGDARTQGGGGIAQQSGNSKSGGPTKGDVLFTMESGAQGDQSAHFGPQTEDGGSVMVGGSGDTRTQDGGGIAQHSGNSRSGGPKKGVTFGGDSSGPPAIRVNNFWLDRIWFSDK